MAKQEAAIKGQLIDEDFKAIQRKQEAEEEEKQVEAEKEQQVEAEKAEQQETVEAQNTQIAQEELQKRKEKEQVINVSD